MDEMLRIANAVASKPADRLVPSPRRVRDDAFCNAVSGPLVQLAKGRPLSTPRKLHDWGRKAVAECIILHPAWRGNEPICGFRCDGIRDAQHLVHVTVGYF